MDDRDASVGKGDVVVLYMLVGKGDVVVQKVASVDNVTDLLTKAFTHMQLNGHLEKMG